MLGVVIVPIILGIVFFTAARAVGAGSICLFVGMLLGAASFDAKDRWSRGRRVMKWCGDSTYGTYLWHVPVQVAILVVTARFGIAPAVFLTPAFMLGYLAFVLVLARASFLWYERPCRIYLNKHLAAAPD